MSDTFTIKRRDNLPILRATLYSDSEHTQPVDLTNADEVHLKVGRVNQSITIDKVMTILSPPTNGKVETQLTTAETNQQPGDYQMEFEVNWVGGDKSTYPKLGYKQFVIVADLDNPEATSGGGESGEPE